MFLTYLSQITVLGIFDIDIIHLSTFSIAGISGTRLRLPSRSLPGLCRPTAKAQPRGPIPASTHRVPLDGVHLGRATVRNRVVARRLTGPRPVVGLAGAAVAPPLPTRARPACRRHADRAWSGGHLPGGRSLRFGQTASGVVNSGSARPEFPDRGADRLRSVARADPAPVSQSINTIPRYIIWLRVATADRGSSNEPATTERRDVRVTIVYL